MPKTTNNRTFTSHALAALIAATPEGFFNRNQLTDSRLGVGDRDAAIAAALAEGLVGQEGDYLFDPTRLDAAQVRELSALYDGSLPALKADGTPAVRPVLERIRVREQRLQEFDDAALSRLVALFEGTPGFLPVEQVLTQPGDDGAFLTLQELNLLKRTGNLIFDPLRITRPSLDALHERQALAPLRHEIVQILSEQPGQTRPRVELVERFGAKAVQKLIDLGVLAAFSVPIPLGESVWIRLKEADADLARRTALETVTPKDEDWQGALELAGTLVKPHVVPGATLREQVLARSYTLSSAAKRLNVRSETLQTAIGSRAIFAFVDPEGQTRIGAAEIADILAQPERLQAVEALELVHTREVRLVFGEAEGKALLGRLRRTRKGIGNRIRWGQVRELLDEPMTLREFRERYRAQREAELALEEEKKAEERRQREEERRRERERREEERRQREELRARLLASFPTWQHAGRADQRVLLHVGPTNSGKTHHALEALAEARSGWYLAPLRLLAFEVFDRLNKGGVRCNLLTGEEHIPVDGANITAATIEMFNPARSGECVVIDEAHMLADPDRGWAWTRALMEARAPEIRVICPPFARALVERLAGAAGMPLELVEHRRLAPLKIADHSWPLSNIPERTILVAFSRRMVLRLKTELEQYRRRVSVIYGNLPPEVRRKQADRFAAGHTEICVATDAVGMGLNLPADNVCFYELEKFDGKQSRPLTSAEVHQIGGRAGRYGLSTAGQIGATTRTGLKMLRRLYENAPEELTKARVSPVVEDLAMIPGSLSRRLAQWRELQSIPDSLRDVIEPADIDERIALAAMLSDKEVEQLGLAAAIQLVNAPTRENSRSFWYACARAILSDQAMPLPFEPPMEIQDDRDLEATETAIACADIYLWLACRPEFGHFAPDEPWLRALRAEWSLSIDAALLRRVDTAARCINCRAKLPLNHRYTLCDKCHAASRSRWW